MNKLNLDLPLDNSANFSDESLDGNDLDRFESSSLISPKLVQAISASIFPSLDAKLRIGLHVNSDLLDEYEFLLAYSDELEQFYRRYNVELVCAAEGFFYLRPKSTTLINRSLLSELDMLVGKVLCCLYLSPEFIAQSGVFSTNEVFDELLSICDEKILLKSLNQRAAGSDLDKSKLFDKVKSSINKLRRMGMVSAVGDIYSNKFSINECVFRFGVDVRSENGELDLIKNEEGTSEHYLASLSLAKNTSDDNATDDSETDNSETDDSKDDAATDFTQKSEKDEVKDESDK